MGEDRFKSLMLYDSNLCEVQNQVKLIYGVRSQDSGLPLGV